jgi:hypothetical protein
LKRHIAAETMRWWNAASTTGISLFTFDFCHFNKIQNQTG